MLENNGHNLARVVENFKAFRSANELEMYIRFIFILRMLFIN